MVSRGAAFSPEGISRVSKALRRGGGCANDGAASAELVVAATPWDALVATVKPLSAALEGKVVVSMANALVKEGREMLAIYPSRGSMAAQLQAALPARLINDFRRRSAGACGAVTVARCAYGD